MAQTNNIFAFKIEITNDHDGDYSLNESEWLSDLNLASNEDHTLFSGTADTLGGALQTIQKFYIQSCLHIEANRTSTEQQLIRKWSQMIDTLGLKLIDFCCYCNDETKRDLNEVISLQDEWFNGNQNGDWRITAIPQTVQIELDLSKDKQVIEVVDGIPFQIEKLIPVQNQILKIEIYNKHNGDYHFKEDE